MAIWFSPECLVPPHVVLSEDKVIRLYYSLKLNGWVGPELVAYWWNNRLQLLSGTHRLAAAKKLGMRVPVRIYSYKSIEEAWGDLDKWNYIMTGSYGDNKIIDRGR